MKNVSIVTLGCSKNDVDSGQMRGVLDPSRFQFTDDVYEAEVIVVNTCGFIDAAKEESIDTILDLAQLKDTGKLETLLLAGCLAQRYPEELLESIPEADGILGPGHIRSLNEAIEEAESGDKPVFAQSLSNAYIEGMVRENVSITEYVKISEGCNNRCSYCIIPYLKGNHRSRKKEEILEEVNMLVAEGAREIILIGQNTTDYGIDLYGRYALAKLVEALSTIDGLRWIRILYAYPDHFDADLIRQMRDNPKVLPYVDIPLQHISDSVLQRMHRKVDRAQIENLFATLREEIPDIAIRTTFLLGFPGETEADFETLLNFIERHPFERAGAFTYSREEGTPAAEYADQVPESIKEDRHRRFMEKQMEISENRMARLIGKTLTVLITECGEGEYIGRSYLDAPDIDGIVVVQSDVVLREGDFVKVRITDASSYDLGGEYLEHCE